MPNKLFQPMQLGDCQLSHRLVMAPLTRYRADDSWMPTSLVKEYYVQRACVPGTLIISEATQISPRCAGRDNCPGIWKQTQIQAWRDIVDAVHERGCFIWCQLWAQGRAGHSQVLRREGFKLQSSSAVPVSADSDVPEEMSEEDIIAVIGDYTNAAKNAMEAGFDGIEVHGGNGYLPDQFLQDTCNKRTDRWGGSIENRSRFHVKVMRSIAEAIGPSKTAIRLSPWSDFLAMGMENPIPQFTHLLGHLRRLNLAWLDLIEARIRGNDDADCGVSQDVSSLIHTWGNTSPVLLSGGFTPETARHTVEVKYKEYDVAIIFGRYWTSNPDLVFRVRQGIALQKYDRSSFYTPKKREGYVDWPFCEAFRTILPKKDTDMSIM